MCQNDQNNVFICRFEFLQKLKNLDLSRNTFMKFPAAIYCLANLIELDISNNKSLRMIGDPIIKLDKLQQLRCDGCSSLIYPLYSICEQGLSAMSQYYKEVCATRELEATEMSASATSKKSSVEQLQTSTEKLASCEGGTRYEKDCKQVKKQELFYSVLSDVREQEHGIDFASADPETYLQVKKPF